MGSRGKDLRTFRFWKMLGGTRERIDCGVSIGIQPSIEKLLAKIANGSSNAGYRRIKIKIKPGWDLEVVRQVRAAFPEHPVDGRCEFGIHAGRYATCSGKWTSTTS